MFNFKSDETDSINLEKIIKENEINNNEFYSKEKFEGLLKKIGLDVILISSQTNALNNNKNNRSLNAHCSNPKDYITCGYISAFEFQKPSIEGILINSLREIDVHEFPKIISSDCHEWEAYPWHDKTVPQFLNNEKKQFTKIKCLPTFKGLMMAFTSPRTRFNRRENKNIVINSIEINNNVIPLSSGINVIIGDNGSGKSAILETLTKNDPPKHYVTFIKKYNLKIPKISNKANFKYVPQSHIFERRNKGKLFSDLILEGVGEIKINHTAFVNKFNDYFEKIILYIEHQININDKKNQLNTKKLKLSTEILSKLYYINVLNTDSIKPETNIHTERNNKLKEIIESLEKEIKENESYYSKFELTDSLQKIKDEFQEIQKIVKTKYELLEKQNIVKNILIQKIKDYNLEIQAKSTSLDNEISEYFKKKHIVINCIIELIKILNKKILFPDFPDLIKGNVIDNKEGYKFTKVAKYDNKDLKNEFYENIFNKKWREGTVKNIKTKLEFIESIKGANINNEDYKEIMKENLQKFFNKLMQAEDSILEASSNTDIGNTPGELSLAYYKFIVQKNSNWEVLLLDQPEENISNKKVYSDLIRYISGLKDNKQIIIVTHNPLLVVNLDIDNVIHIKKNKKEIEVSNGCLEYEDTNYNILSLIANDMDGGYDAIEKRIKIYDKKN